MKEIMVGHMEDSIKVCMAFVKVDTLDEDNIKVCLKDNTLK